MDHLSITFSNLIMSVMFDGVVTLRVVNPIFWNGKVDQNPYWFQSSRTLLTIGYARTCSIGKLSPKLKISLIFQVLAENAGILYLIVITKFRFFHISKPTLPYFTKKLNHINDVN